ncbi:MAG: hypothetical protein DWI57_03325 [Chloroflexi bacterium]|nr:MAG: hypothetical protein DWI57_03325 [Chloroflexota bacterium]
MKTLAVRQRIPPIVGIGEDSIGDEAISNPDKKTLTAVSKAVAGAEGDVFDRWEVIPSVAYPTGAIRSTCDNAKPVNRNRMIAGVMHSISRSDFFTPQRFSRRKGEWTEYVQPRCNRQRLNVAESLPLVIDVVGEGQYKITAVGDIESALAAVGVLLIRLQRQIFRPGEVQNIGAFPLSTVGAVNAHAQTLELEYPATGVLDPKTRGDEFPNGGISRGEGEGFEYGQIGYTNSIRESAAPIALATLGVFGLNFPTVIAAIEHRHRPTGGRLPIALPSVAAATESRLELECVAVWITAVLPAKLKTLDVFKGRAVAGIKGKRGMGSAIAEKDLYRGKLISQRTPGEILLIIAEFVVTPAELTVFVHSDIEVTDDAQGAGAVVAYGGRIQIADITGDVSTIAAVALFAVDVNTRLAGVIAIHLCFNPRR